jgi:hypothetical protein
MCDPVSATIAATAIGATAYSSNQQKKATNAAINNANQQADLNRQAEAARAEQERNFQTEQSQTAQNAADERFRQEQEQARLNRELQERIAAEQRAAEDARRQAAEAEAERVRQAELRRQQNIAEGQGIISELFGQFNDDFYNQRSQSYVDYARPQLDQQYNQAMQGLVRSLARTGNLNSSVRGQSMADLRDQYNRGLFSITDQGNRYANDARSSIEMARGNLLSQNATLADPGTVRSLAQSQASSLSGSPSFTPLQSLINALTRNSQMDSSVPGTAERKPTAGVNLFASAPSVATGSSVN